MPDKILLIDDDQDFREEFKNSLEEYEVIEANNGEEALALLRKPNEIDLAILDVVMPGLNGIDVLKELRRLSPDIGIIMLTGYSSKDIAVEALRAHADDYLEKPPDIDKTKAVIEKVLDGKRRTFTSAGGANSKVERIKRFAERNSHKRTCLKDAAAAIYLSPKYLSRIFKQNTGTRFSEFRLEIKMNEAKSLLKDTDFNVNQIADRLGYQNAESFIRIFKKITGFTPTEFRKKGQKTAELTTNN
jgi:YesN/AraC family two-component response regulator